MSIRAILKDGVIQPVDPLPAEWRNGESLVVNSIYVGDAETPPTKQELDAWEAEMEEGARQIAPEDHAAFLRAIEEHRREAKLLVRREWGLE